MPGASAESPQIDEIFAAAWRRHAAEIRDRCRAWMGGSEADADEAFSHAGLRIYRKLRDHHRKVRNLQTWMLRVTQNVCRNLHRERRNEVESDFDPNWLELRALEPSAAVPETVNPEERCMQQELEEFLVRSIAELPASLQAAMRIHLTSASHREAAARLGINEASVRKRIQRAREILRQQLADYRSGRTRLSRRASAKCL